MAFSIFCVLTNTCNNYKLVGGHCAEDEKSLVSDFFKVTLVLQKKDLDGPGNVEVYKHITIWNTTDSSKRVRTKAQRNLN